MNPTRRTFLSSLSALPLIGWLFGRAEAKPQSFPAKITGGYVRQTFPIEPDEDRTEGSPHGEAESLQEYHATRRVIRWIPVTERLPTWETVTDEQGNVMHGWARVLTRSDDDCFEINIAHFSNGQWTISGWGRPTHTITHWAELPQGPNTETQP